MKERIPRPPIAVCVRKFIKGEFKLKRSQVVDCDFGSFRGFNDVLFLITGRVVL